MGKRVKRLLNDPLEPGITVVTTTTGTRHEMIAQCAKCVSDQTLPPKHHIFVYDTERKGGGWALNRALELVNTEYFAIYADDDILYPHHLETLMNNIGDADMIYPFCEMEGFHDYLPEYEYFNRGWKGDEQDHFDFQHNPWIPATVLMRTDVALSLDGFDTRAFFEDHNMWQRMILWGYKIKCVEEVTWCYRLHGGNISLQDRRTRVD